MKHEYDDCGCLKARSLRTQVAGSHYAEQKIQPVEFAMANGWDFCASSILKYVTRHPQKNGLQDLEKAAHFIELRHDTIKLPYQPPTQVISAQAYCIANGLGPPETRVLIALEDWCLEDSPLALNSLRAAMASLLRVVQDRSFSLPGRPADYY